MRLNCLITGVGGQGTVLLARLIGAAAINKGFKVKGTETIGMAQRGGSVVSHLRMSGALIHSPLIPLGQADIIIAFEQAEAVRVLPFLAPAGRLLVLDRPVMPVSSSLQAGAATADKGAPSPYDPAAMTAFLKKSISGSDRLTIINGQDLVEKCGGARFINVALLGAAIAKKALPFTAEDIFTVLQDRIKPAFLEMNKKALEAGADLI